MQTFPTTWRLGLVALLAVGVAGLSFSAARADDPPKAPADPPKDPPKEAPKGDEPTKPKEGEKPAEKPAKPPICEALIASEVAKDFTLKDLDGKERKLSEFKGKWVVLEWTNYECGFVKKFYTVTPAADGKPATPGKMPQLQKTYTEKGVIWLSICSSAPGKEGHMSPEKWKEAVKERMAAPTAVLLDTDGKVGREIYGARRTPTVWIVDPKGKVAYHGAPDDAPTPKADPLTAKNYIAEFLDAALAGKELPAGDNKPYG